jgi:anti-sigma regulatory factor (Ser/Thr protein kinase)
VEVKFRLSDDVIEMQFQDGGRPFDPLSAAEPNRTAPLQERAPGGVGIHIVRNLMSEVAYSRVDDKNRLVVRRRLRTEEYGSGSA